MPLQSWLLVASSGVGSSGPPHSEVNDFAIRQIVYCSVIHVLSAYQNRIVGIYPHSGETTDTTGMVAMQMGQCHHDGLVGQCSHNLVQIGDACTGINQQGFFFPLHEIE